MGNDYRKLAGNAGQKDIRLCGGMVPGFSSGNAHVGFKMIDGSFDNGPDLVKSNPFLRVSLNTGKHTEIHIFIGISGATFFSSTAGFFTVADPCPLLIAHFGAAPFDTVSPSLLPGNTQVLHGEEGVFRASGISVFIISYFLESAFIPGIIWNQGF